MQSRRQSWSFQQISQALCFFLLLQGSGIAQALPLPPKQIFVSKDDLDSARVHRAKTPVEPGLLRRFVDETWTSAGESVDQIRGWLEDAWAPASPAAGREAPLRVAQAGGTLPLPARLMPAVFAAPLQGGPPGPPSRAGAETEATPPAEAARLLEKAGTDQIPLVAGWNLVSIPLELADPDPAAVFAPIAGQLLEVAHVDVCDAADPEKIYDPADPAGSDLAAVTPGMGLWVKVTTATILPLTGTLPATATLELCPGWNHLGLPVAEPLHPHVALSSIAGKWVRVFGFNAFDPDPWDGFDPAAPAWANDLPAMRPGSGYWVLASEAATLTISNQGPPPTIALAAPADLSVITEPTEVTGTVDSDRLESWTLTATPKDDGAPVTLASGTAPVSGPGVLATFDPTLLLNGLYELELTATDVQGQQVSESVSVTVEGQMKIGHFTLSFVDLAIPVSGLAIEILRTYRSRDQQQRDFGVGWSLDVRQGSYVNNRPPGDGWQLQTGLLPCDTVLESKSHLTVVRLSDQEVYRFALKLQDGASTGGGCFATARFDFVDGPLPGTTLEILGNTSVFWENGSDQVIDADSFELYEPEDVKLTTRDGRIFELDLNEGVTRLEDLNGNQLTITPTGITHSNGNGIAFERDTEGRITLITDPLDHVNAYTYDAAGDLVSFTDRAGAISRFTYDDHRLLAIEDPRGIKPIRNEYDSDGRLVRHLDAYGKVIVLKHDLQGRREIVTNRLGHSRIVEYDDRGNVLTDTDESGNVTTRTYNGRDRLLSETDALGNTTINTYDANGDLTSIQDPLGEKIHLTHNPQGRLLTITDPLGNVTTNTYDSRGNLLSNTDPLGNTSSFTFDSQGNLKTETDAEGNITTYYHDAAGNVTRITNALGHETRLTYDALGNPLSQTASRTLPDGTVEPLTSTFTVDALGRRTMTTLPDGSTTRTAYDPLGAVIETEDARGNITRFSYDSAGRLLDTIHPDGTTDSIAYDIEGRLLTTTDRNGSSTSFTYDPVGRPVVTTFADGTSTTATYDAAGRLTTTTDARGSVTAYGYDAAGRRTRVTDHLGFETLTAFDEAGRSVSHTDALGRITRFEYDAAGRLVKTRLPDGEVIRSLYDSRGRRVAQIDQAGVSTEFEYDALGRLTQVVDALDGITRFTYDEQGNRLSLTDANGHVTRFEYDPLGRRTKRILPDGAAETFLYDSAGNRIEHQDFAGQVTTYAYDSSDRLIARNNPDGTSNTVTYTPRGQRRSISDERGVTRYEYDTLNRLVRQQMPEGYELLYTYDSAGNRTSMAVDLGAGVSFATQYTYDALNRLKTATNSRGGVYIYDYDAASQRARLRYPNGAETSYSYDSVGRLLGLQTAATSGQVIQSHDYTLGPVGNRLAISEHDGTVRTYEFDLLYRLTSERVEASDATLQYQNVFAYDPVGNRIQQDRTASDGSVENVVYTYDARDRLLTETSALRSLAYQWDVHGNEIAKTGTDPNGTSTNVAYTWDHDNRLVGVALDDQTAVTHRYDADGVWLGQEVAPGSDTAESRHWIVDTSGPLSQIVGALDANDEIEAEYVRGVGGNELLGLLPSIGDDLAYHVDGLGSVRAMTDAGEGVTERYAYEAFGELIEPNAPTQPFLFAGDY